MKTHTKITEAEHRAAIRAHYTHPGWKAAVAALGTSEYEERLQDAARRIDAAVRLPEMIELLRMGLALAIVWSGRVEKAGEKELLTEGMQQIEKFKAMLRFIDAPTWED